MMSEMELDDVKAFNKDDKENILFDKREVVELSTLDTVMGYFFEQAETIKLELATNGIKMTEKVMKMVIAIVPLVVTSVVTLLTGGFKWIIWPYGGMKRFVLGDAVHTQLLARLGYANVGLFWKIFGGLLTCLHLAAFLWLAACLYDAFVVKPK